MMMLRRLGAAFDIALVVFGAMPSCTATANVSDVWLSLDADGARHRTVFYTDTKAIYCIAEVAAGRNNATLEMQLRRVQSFDPGLDGPVPEGLGNIDLDHFRQAQSIRLCQEGGVSEPPVQAGPD